MVVLAFPLQGRERKEMSAGKPCRAALLRGAVKAFCPKTTTIAVNIDGDCCSTDIYCKGLFNEESGGDREEAWSQHAHPGQGNRSMRTRHRQSASWRCGKGCSERG